MSANSEQTTGKVNAIAAAAEEMSVNMDSVAAASEEILVHVNMIVQAAEEMSTTIPEISSKTDKTQSITETDWQTCLLKIGLPLNWCDSVYLAVLNYASGRIKIFDITG